MFKRRILHSVLRLTALGAQPSAVYQHAPLDHPRSFRLLDFFDDESADNNKYILRTVSLDDDEIFTAISYVWGNAGATSTIRCNGVDRNITPNLATILSTVRNLMRKNRDQNASRISIWVDALCINQDDIGEREQQVKIMGQIYRKADVVIAYVGEAENDTEDVIAFMHQMIVVVTDAGVEECEREQFIASMDHLARITNERLSKDQRQNLIQHSNFQNTRELPSWDNPVISAIKRFFLRPWFSRGWTFQEAVLSREFHILWGNHLIRSETIYAAVVGALMMGYMTEFSEAFRFLDTFSLQQDIVQKEVERPPDEEDKQSEIISSDTLLTRRTLSSLLINTHDRDTSDGRDKIYSILGIIKSADHQLLKIDYGRPLDAVYIDATRYCVEEEKDLSVFGSIASVDPGVQCKKTPNLPSWVADWQSISPEQMVLSKWDECPVYQASRDSELTAIACADPSTIILKGLIIGRIEQIIDTSYKTFLENAFDATPDEWFSTLHQLANSIGLDEPYSILPSFRSTIQTLLVAAQFPTVQGWDESKYSYVMRDTISWVKEGSPQPFPLRVLDEFMLKASEVIDLRSIFATENNKYVGLAPEQCQLGDYVCILLGGKVPYLLRPRTPAFDDASSISWTFLGECYVQGIMDGAAMDGKGNDYTDFSIC